MSVDMAMKVKSRARTLPSLLKRMVMAIRKHALLGPGQHLLVAVSGGPDSTALVSLLHRLAASWDLTLTAIHFNYRLRGAESEADESFVRQWCADHHVPLVVQYLHVSRGSKRGSLQQSARDLRYKAMQTVAKEIGADRIVLGHTADDQAETMLMWMLRGAGLSGLAGMPYVRDERIVRPLLGFTRNDVLSYLDHEGVPYRQDSSNAKPVYFRNRIRNELMPVARRLAPAVVSVLKRQADLLREDEAYLHQVVASLYPSCVATEKDGSQRVDRQKLTTLPVALQRRVIRRLLQLRESTGRAPSLRVVEAVRHFLKHTRSGTRLSLPSCVFIQRQNYVMVSRSSGTDPSASQELPLPIPSVVYWGRTKFRFEVQLMTRERARQLPPQSGGVRALFDARRCSTPLVIRTWRPGDRFAPRGMKGRTRKLQDFFTDLKVRGEERNQVPILAAPEGILWVVGKRQDERFMVDDSTNECLVVTVDMQVKREGA
jgi:tRNA(Ile)-lysidine synthase